MTHQRRAGTWNWRRAWRKPRIAVAGGLVCLGEAEPHPRRFERCVELDPRLERAAERLGLRRVGSGGRFFLCQLHGAAGGQCRGADLERTGLLRQGVDFVGRLSGSVHTGGGSVDLLLQFISWDLEMSGNSAFHYFYSDEDFARPKDYGLVQ